MSEGDPRPLAPAPPPTPRAGDRSSTSTKKASIACGACKRIKRKCDQGHPCQNCRKAGTPCVYDESLDNRRKLTAKRHLNELDYHRNVLYSLFESIRSFDAVHIQRLLAMIRHNSTLDDIVSCIDDGLSELEKDDANPDSTAVREKLLEARAKLGHLESISPTRSRRRTMNIEDLNNPPILVPAKPWTSVTDDDLLVSHLVSLWFTWVHQYHLFIDRDLFLRDMRAGKVGASFCSPFLVNVILSQACHYSDDPEACLVPGDLSTSGDHFYGEARRLWDAEEGRVSLTNVHGVYGMVLKETVTGKDRVGWMFLRQLNNMYRDLGWEESRRGKQSSTTTFPEEYAKVSAITAHSVPIVNTLYGLAFLQPVQIKPSWLDKPFLEQDFEHTIAWEPYPMMKPALTSHPYRVLDELCKLTDIGMAVQDLLFDGTQNEIVGTDLQKAVDEISQRLVDWKHQLPPWFNIEGDAPPTPDVFELHCQYEWTLTTLFHFLKYPINSPSDLPKDAALHDRAREICCQSAERIAHLAGVFRNAYGLSRVPLILVQAGNVAALTLVDELATSAYSEAFHDICVVLVSGSRRMPLVKGKVRMIWLMVEQRGTQLPPDTESLLKDFSSQSWKDEDQLGFSSTYPNYSVARETDDVREAGMSDLLERWEAAKRITNLRLQGKRPKDEDTFYDHR